MSTYDESHLVCVCVCVCVHISPLGAKRAIGRKDERESQMGVCSLPSDLV